MSPTTKRGLQHPQRGAPVAVCCPLHCRTPPHTPAPLPPLTGQGPTLALSLLQRASHWTIWTSMTRQGEAGILGLAIQRGRGGQTGGAHVLCSLLTTV